MVTPEAVRLDFEEATVGSRGVAIVVDWMIQSMVLLVASLAGGLLVGAGVGLPPWVGFTLVTLLGFLVIFGYPIGFETLMRGRTPGKMIMGLRVVTVEGAPVSMRHASIRAALVLVDFILTSGFAGVLTALLSNRSQRIGDHLAGTVVVRERTGAGSTTAVEFTVPEGFGGYAETLDPAGMRSDDYQTVRAFLLRAPTLAPARRADLGQRLARGVARRISHQLPPQVHPEAFLRCVAARYQERGRPAPSVQTSYKTPAPPAPVPRRSDLPQGVDEPSAPEPATHPQAGGGFTAPG